METTWPGGLRKVGPRRRLISALGSYGRWLGMSHCRQSMSPNGEGTRDGTATQWKTSGKAKVMGESKKRTCVMRKKFAKLIARSTFSQAKISLNAKDTDVHVCMHMDSCEACEACEVVRMTCGQQISCDEIE